MPLHPLGLGQQKLQCVEQFSFLGFSVERVVVRAAHEISAAATRAGERRIRLPRQLGEALVKHVVVQRFHHLSTQIADDFRARWRQLPQHTNGRCRDFLVGGDRHQRRIVAGYRCIETRAFSRAPGNIAKGPLDQRLQRIRVCIPNRNHGHQVRAIPITPEAFERGRVCLLENFRLPDGETIGIARTAKDHGKLFGPNAFARAKPDSPLRQHDAAFGDHLGRIEQHTEGDIAEKTKALLQNAGAVGRHRQDVDRFVESCLRVEVGAKSHADRFQILDDIVLREAFGTIERHVLDEVREPLLIIILENRAGVHDQTQLGALLRLLVAAHVVAQSIRQRPDAYRWIDRQRRRERERIFDGSRSCRRLLARQTLRL